MTSTSKTINERSSLLLSHSIPKILKNHAYNKSSSKSLPSNLNLLDSNKPKVMSDPKEHLTNAFHLAGLVNDHGGEYEKYRMPPEKLKKMSKQTRQFYERQNEILDYFQEIDDVLDSSRRRSHSGLTPERRKSQVHDLESATLSIDEDDEDDDDDHSPASGSSAAGPVESAQKLHRENQENSLVKKIIHVNFFINFFLLVGKILMALLSNSISLIASLVDSAMDFLSTAIIWWTNRTIDSKSWQSIWHYPVGKRRMEPMGIVVFSVFMISSFVQVLVESIERLFAGSQSNVPITSIMVMIITILVKGLVWLWCRRKKNSSVKALAHDAENDCILNVFSLLFPYLGLKLNLPWLDAVGGLILSLYIIIEWSGTLFDNVRNLTGRRADPIQHQRVAYLVTRFSPLIQAVQHCHVYQAGDDFIVETDVILSPDTSLPVAHDVGEAVQYALESLDGISRAYCHVDFSSNPMSGHFQR